MEFVEFYSEFRTNFGGLAVVGGDTIVFASVDSVDGMHCGIVPWFSVSSDTPTTELCHETFCLGGQFVLDSVWGNIYYEPPATAGCGAEMGRQRVYCIEFCDSFPRPRFGLTNVLSATATRYSDDWEVDTAALGATEWEWNDFEIGRRGRWAPVQSYVYRDSVIQGGRLSRNGPERVYTDAGVIADTVILYDHVAPLRNDPEHWLPLDSVTAIDRFGGVVEEVDVLGIPSAAITTRREGLPVMVASNTRRDGIFFESFEGPDVEVAGLAQGVGHTGRRSVLLGSGSPTVAGRVILQRGAYDSSAILRYWVKTSYHGSGITDSLGHAAPVALSVPPIDVSTPRRIAQTGEWTLFEAVISSTDTNAFHEVVEVLFTAAISSDSVWVDDIRIQPRGSQAVCYVYDHTTLRPVATFDDQHFAVLYQYTAEGKLRRTLRETERGVLTVAEGHYHTPLRPRSDTAYSSPALSGQQSAVPAVQFASLFSDADAPSLSAGESSQVLDVRLSTSGEAIRLFGSRPMTWKELRDLDLPTLREIRLPESERFGFLQEVGRLEQQLGDVERQLAAATDDGERELLERSRQQLLARAGSLCSRVGLSPQRGEELLEEMRSIRNEVESTTTTGRKEGDDVAE